MSLVVVACGSEMTTTTTVVRRSVAPTTLKPACNPAQGANLSGCDFSGARLRGVDLTRANLRNANFSGADLSTSVLFFADMRGANLTGANLAGANMRGVDLTNANVTNSDWYLVDMGFRNLPGAANLTGITGFGSHPSHDVGRYKDLYNFGPKSRTP